MANYEPRVIRRKVRTVDAETGKIAKTKTGKPVDGGGWPTNKYGWGKGRRQSSHMNESK